MPPLAGTAEAEAEAGGSGGLDDGQAYRGARRALSDARVLSAPRVGTHTAVLLATRPYALGEGIPRTVPSSGFPELPKF